MIKWAKALYLTPTTRPQRLGRLDSEYPTPSAAAYPQTLQVVQAAILSRSSPRKENPNPLRKSLWKIPDQIYSLPPTKLPIRPTVTHPSDHHAVAIVNPGEPNAAEAQLKRVELAKRAKDLKKSVEKEKADQWGEVMHKRVGGHAPSFLCPVQYGVQFPFGQFGQGDCTALSGRGLQSASAAGECCKGNGMNGLCGAQFDQKRGGPIESMT